MMPTLVEQRYEFKGGYPLRETIKDAYDELDLLRAFHRGRWSAPRWIFISGGFLTWVSRSRGRTLARAASACCCPPVHKGEVPSGYNAGTSASLTVPSKPPSMAPGSPGILNRWVTFACSHKRRQGRFDANRPLS